MFDYEKRRQRLSERMAHDLSRFEPVIMSVVEDAINRMIDGLRDAHEIVAVMEMQLGVVGVLVDAGDLYATQRSTETDDETLAQIVGERVSKGDAIVDRIRLWVPDEQVVAVRRVLASKSR